MWINWGGNKPQSEESGAVSNVNTDKTALSASFTRREMEMKSPKSFFLNQQNFTSDSLLSNPEQAKDADTCSEEDDRIRPKRAPVEQTELFHRLKMAAIANQP